MRRLSLFCSDEKSDFLESLSSASSAIIAPLTQGDTIQLAVTKMVRPDNPSTTLAAFVVKPWSFSQIRFTLGYIDRAPESGTFKLAITGGLTTAAISWPTDPTDATLANFRAAIVAAINAVAGTGAVRMDNPTGTPANFAYLTWTSPTDERVITITENRLVPAIDTDQVVTNTQPLPAFQQLLKLARLPLISTSTFAFPSNGAPDVSREVGGATGVNEVQIIAVNSSAVGAFDLTWSGARTSPLSIQGLSAAQIATALNALVVDGATNPSFSVSARAASSGLAKFAVSFIGPLAAALQTLLVATALQQESQTTAFGTIELRRELFERALNGAASCKLTAELVIVDAGGESTILRELTLLNDMTGPGTESAIAAGGGILILPTTVYIDESTADPFMTAAAGLAYTVPIIAVGASIVSVPHTEFESLIVGVRVHKQIGLNITENWVECKDTEYGNSSSDSTATVVTFPFNFVNDITSQYHYAYWKILLTDPDATVSLVAGLKLTWDDVLASLPSGQTLTAKLAAIDAALGVFGGTLRVSAGNIDGTLAAAQIDAAGLAPSIVNAAPFSTALQSLYATNSTLVTTLLTQLAASSTFASTLVTAITNNTSITDAISNALSTNATFTSNLQSLVLDVIQGTGNLPAGATLYALPAVSILVPPPQQMRAPGLTRTVPGTEQTSTTGGGTTSTITRTVDVTETTPSFVPRYAALSPQVTGSLTNGGTLTGTLPATAAAGTYYTVSGSAEARHARGRAGRTFADGKLIAFTGGHWAEMVNISGILYPVELEVPLFPELEIDAAELYAGSRFSLTVPLFFQMLGNATGGITLIAEQRDLATTTYAQIFAATVHLSAIARLRSFSLTVTKAAGGALSGAYTIQGQSTSFDPAANALGLRWRLTKATIDTNPDPRGTVSITAPKGAILASTVAL